jgi:hypothetical protein
LLALSAATSAFAQGMFYAEEQKDGRVYVFNNKANWERFKASGETGTGLTRLNAGPAARRCTPTTRRRSSSTTSSTASPRRWTGRPVPKAILSYRDGQTTAEFDKAQVTFTNRLQLRFTEQLPTTRCSSRARRPRATASLLPHPPLRAAVPGWIYSKDLTYKLEFAFQDLQGNTNTGAINDAYFNYDFNQGQEAVPPAARAVQGALRPPGDDVVFNLQFVDRSIVAGEYEKGRDLGVMVDGLLATRRSRGTRAPSTATAATRPRMTTTSCSTTRASSSSRSACVVAYSEADFETTDKPLFSIAGQYEQNSLFNTTTANDLKREIFGGDAVFKYKGLFVQGEYFDRKFTPETGVSYKSNGYNAEAGYAFSHRKWEVAFRYSSWDPTDLKDDDDRTEVGGAVNWFYNRHFAKIQADFASWRTRPRRPRTRSSGSRPSCISSPRPGSNSDLTHRKPSVSCGC